MEFKFRAIDAYRSYRSSSPSLSYFSEQAWRINYTKEPDFMNNPRDIYTIQREIEKERIRHEIITAEKLHRQLLEEEVRRELMMEREMTMHKASEMSLSIEERFSMQLPTRFQILHPFNNRWLEDRFAFPGKHGMGFGRDALPPTLPQFSDATEDESRSALEVNKKDKLIMLAKPNPNLCGSKRKAATPPAGSGVLPLMSSKKPKEWSCALCQVSATSERGLNEHLQGKKHKNKEAGLIRAQRLCNNSTSFMSKKSGKLIKLTESGDSASQEMKHLQGKKRKTKEAGLIRAQKMCSNSTSSMSKKSRKQIKLTESRDSAGQEIKIKVEEESVEASKIVIGLDQKMENVEDSQNKNEELSKKGLDAKTQKKKIRIPTAEKTKRKLPNRKKFRFWCEDCQVGTHSAVVMEGHKRGKKHMARLIESMPDGEVVPATTCVKIMAPSQTTEKVEDEDVAEELKKETTDVITEKAEDEDVVAEDANEETAENVTGDSDGTGSSIVADVLDPMQQTP